MPDKQQMDKFKEAVEEKNRAAEEAAEAGPQNPEGSEVEGDQPGLIDSSTPQETRDTRKKNTGHGKVTADKWNQ